MQRIPVNLNSIRAARSLRSGTDRETICGELGISARSMDRIESLYSNVPDALLAHIERLLNEREKLRNMVSNLIRRNKFFP